jgi:hypothetical protein
MADLRSGIQLAIPAPDEIDLERVAFHYDRVSDTLLVYFFGAALPAFSVDVNDFEYLRMELDSHRVVGLQIEAFLLRAIWEDPRYLLWSVRAGIGLDELARSERQLSPATFSVLPR